jgi:ABC-type antimicrobial peptide transport system permease subunit
MLGPFNNPGADESGFYVPFFSTAFGPAAPGPLAPQFGTILIKPRAGLRIEDMGNVLRREMRKADSNLPLYFVGTPASHLDGFVSQNRIIATMFTIFGVVAIVLASVGIYGVMSFSVNRRTQEFGLRMALGANARRILTMVIGQGGVQVAIGLLLGLGLAYGLAVVGGAGIQGQLFGITPTDPLTFSLVAGLVVVVSLAATFVPARRATRVDPMIAFRAE